VSAVTVSFVVMSVRNTYMQRYFSILLALRNKFKLKYAYQTMDIKTLLGPFLSLVCLQFFTKIVRCGNSGNKGFQMSGDSIPPKIPKNETSFSVSGSLSGSANYQKTETQGGGLSLAEDKVREISINCHSTKVKADIAFDMGVKHAEKGNHALAQTYMGMSDTLTKTYHECESINFKFLDSMNHSTNTTSRSVEGGGSGSASGSKVASVLETKILALSPRPKIEDLDTTVRVNTKFMYFSDSFSYYFLKVFVSISFSTFFIAVNLYVLIQYCRAFFFKEFIFSYIDSLKKIKISFGGIFFYLLGVSTLSILVISTFFIESNLYLLKDWLYVTNYNQVLMGG
jgi:hypothetical protein